MTSLLKTIPIEGSHGDYIHKRFEKMHYHSLIRKNFSDIHIALRNDQGDSHYAFSEKKVATRLKKIKVKYCCNPKDYEKYHVTEVGKGMPYYSGRQFQRGVASVICFRPLVVQFYQ